MKRGVLNYSMTWMQDGEKREELHFSKIRALKAYMDILTRFWDTPYSHDNISSLRLWEIYKSGRIEDITGDVNRFLEK